MNRELRERTLLPVLIPVLAILITEVVVFSMSRVLLTTGGTPAVVVALGTALAILVGAAAIAARPKIKSNAIVGLLVVLLIGSVAAAGLAMQRGPFYGDEGPHVEADLEVSAANLAFSVDTLELAAAGTVVAFANEDTQAHNIAVYPSKEQLASPLFRGDIIQGGDTVNYEIPAIDVGTYYFHCDVHPNMNGDTEVTEAGPSSPAGSEATDA
jgi:plastocyanin